jgi:hypothetical protein
MTDSIVVDTIAGGTGIGSAVSNSWVNKSKYGSAIIIILLVVVVVSVAYCKDGFTNVSPDGVVAKKSSQKQIRSDTHIDRTWNLEQLERSVALLNRKS